MLRHFQFRTAWCTAVTTRGAGAEDFLDEDEADEAFGVSAGEKKTHIFGAVVRRRGIEKEPREREEAGVISHESIFAIYFF